MPKNLLRLVPLIPLTLCLARAQDITGDWLGTLARQSGDLRVALHITKTDTGLKGTLDSVDQGVTGIPLDSIKLAESRLTFSVEALHVSYEGKVDAAAAAIEGTVTGGSGSRPLNFRRGTVAKAEYKPANPSDIDGDWTGTFNTGDQQTDVVFHIMNTEAGLMATMDIPTQSVKGAGASSVKRSDSSLAIEWKVFGSRFEGKIAEDRSAIEGSVTQAGNTVPLKLKRTK